jgi:CspA family cold shock protein
MSSTDDVTEVHTKEVLGRVKWFNNKAGYGFITVCDGEFKEKDIFTHFSAIKVTNSQYKYLMQGEYVQFDLGKSLDGPHEYKALNVTGVKCGELMCETVYKQKPRPTQPPRNNARHNDEKKPDSDGFVTVGK